MCRRDARWFRGKSYLYRLELIAAPNGLRVAPVARVRIKRVSELVLAFIGMRVRPLGGTQQGKAQDVAFGIVSVFAIVQQTEAVVMVREVCPLQGGHFKLGLLRRRAPRGGAFDGAIGGFKCRLLLVRA